MPTSPSVTPADLGISLDVDETGDTYEENAALKAIAFAQASGLPSSPMIPALRSTPSPAPPASAPPVTQAPAQTRTT